MKLPNAPLIIVWVDLDVHDLDDRHDLGVVDVPGLGNKDLGLWVDLGVFKNNRLRFLHEPLTPGRQLPLLHNHT